MQLPTRKQKRRERWLVRREDVDYGPYSTDQLLEEIARRHVDLGTMICEVRAQEWEPAGSHALFRDHYAHCEERWVVEEAEQDAERHEQKMKTMRVVKGSTWALILGGSLCVLALGGWLTWRFMHLKPSGILESLALAAPPPLPAPPAPNTSWEPLPDEPGTKVAKLREREHYDTAGVGAEGSGGPLVTSMEFDEAGGGPGGPALSEAALKKITSTARGGLVRCAQTAAGRSASFRGTTVTFIVRSGRLGSFTVGNEVRKDAPFKACVKKALKRVSVPKFSGSERRVTVPLRVQR